MTGPPPPPHPSSAGGRRRLKGQQATTETGANRSAVGPATGPVGDPQWEKTVADAVAVVQGIQQEALQLSAAAQQKTDARQKAHQVQLASIKQEQDQKAEGLLKSLRLTVQRAGPWALPIDQLAGNPQIGAGVPAVLRIGTLSGGLSGLPALVPFGGEQNVIVEASGADTVRAANLVQELALRVFSSIREGKVRLTLIDAGGGGDNLVGLLLPTEYDDLEVVVGNRIMTKATDIAKCLAALVEARENVSQRYLRLEFPTLADYNRAQGAIEEPYQLLVVAGFPRGFDEDSVEQLLRLAESGRRAGIMTLVSVDTEQRPRHVDMAPVLEDLRRTGSVIRIEGERASAQWPQFRIPSLFLDAPAPGEAFNRITSAIAVATKKEKSRKEIKLTEQGFVANRDAWWLGDDGKDRSSLESLEIPIGQSGRSVISLRLGGAGAAQSALVVGRTNSGKSNLLHVLIMGLATRYSPKELELHLVDFKEGVEFNPYAPTSDGGMGLPHVRTLAIESDREFGLSVLRGLVRVCQDRGRKFTASRNAAENLASYRLGLPPDHPDDPDKRMPRILLVMDEFQALFAQPDRVSEEAQQALEYLARQGRGFGVHMVLASQAISNIREFSNAIQDQIAVRIAMQMGERESAHLMDNNTQAATLDHPGEAFYYDLSKGMRGPLRIQTYFLPRAELRPLVDAATDRAHSSGIALSPPVVFRGDQPARLEERAPGLLSAVGGAGVVVKASLGLPTQVGGSADVEFGPERGKSLLIVGTDEDAAVGMLTAAVANIAACLGEGSGSLTIINALRPGSAHYAVPRLLSAVLPNTNTVPTDHLLDALEEPYRLAQQEGPADLRRFIVGFGLHRSQEAHTAEAIEAMKTILAKGGHRGIHLIGWWDSLASLRRQVEFERLEPEFFDIRVLLWVSFQDSDQIVPGSRADQLRANRVLVWTADDPSNMRVLIPFGVPESAWLQKLGSHLGRA